MFNHKIFSSGIPLLLLLILLLLLPAVGKAYHVSLLISIFLYTILTVNWSMFSAATGYMSLASAAFFGVGVYTMAVLGETLPVVAAILIGGFLSFFVALLVGFSCLRLKGVYFSIFTFGLSELMRHSIQFYEAEVSGTIGRLVVEIDPKAAYYSMLVIAVISLIMVYRFRASKYGLALRSIGEAETAASCAGVNVNALKVIVFAITAFFMGIAGAVVVTQWSYIDSHTAFNMFYSFMPVVMATFGGIKRIKGQILGAVILTLLAESLLIQFPYLYMLLFGTMVLSVILFFPGGLIGVVELVKHKCLTLNRGKGHANT